MQEIITHQLQRAVVTTPHALSEKVSVDSCIEQIISALGKVYSDKHISFKTNTVENANFKGDRRDLMEILGNITDNACKACHSTVEINVLTEKTISSSAFMMMDKAFPSNSVRMSWKEGSD